MCLMLIGATAVLICVVAFSLIEIHGLALPENASARYDSLDPNRFAEMQLRAQQQMFFKQPAYESDACPHHEYYPESAGEDQGQLTSHLMLTSGFEDLPEVKLCLEDIKQAKASVYLEDVIWLVRGRGVDALGRPEGVLTRPAEIIQLAREVKASGVRIIVSTDALRQQQISAANLDPKATDLADNPSTLMVELVARGYQVIRY